MKKISIAIMMGALSLCVLTTAQTKTAAASKSETKTAQQAPWAIQVERVDSSVIQLPPEFSVAIYEDLVDQITNAKRFENVFRSGDRQAEKVTNLLTLKTTVEKFQQGSETTRAVTTVGGFTKIFVRMQLATKDGRLLIDKTVEGKIRFVGENLKATHDLTKGMTKLLAQTSLTQ